MHFITADTDAEAWAKAVALTARSKEPWVFKPFPTYESSKGFHGTRVTGKACPYLWEKVDRSNFEGTFVVLLGKVFAYDDEVNRPYCGLCEHQTTCLLEGGPAKGLVFTPVAEPGNASRTGTPLKDFGPMALEGLTSLHSAS